MPDQRGVEAASAASAPTTPWLRKDCAACATPRTKRGSWPRSPNTGARLVNDPAQANIAAGPSPDRCAACSANTYCCARRSAMGSWIS
ncbi:hypothetical protein G6F40_018207 [Rhizopus arrhizus]|nr:hypothetical protein G6F40_018207 [Rhizopus arrhizus]